MIRKELPLTALLGFSLCFAASASDEADLIKEVKLAEYTNLVAERIVSEITDEDVENEITMTLEEYADHKEITDRPAQLGDTVNIDFVGYVDGEELEGGSEENSILVLGSDEFVEGFEEGIVGMKVNEVKDVVLTFPDDYFDLAGLEATFHITLNSIQEIDTPEFNDAFVKEYTDYKNIDDYKKGIRSELIPFL